MWQPSNLQQFHAEMNFLAIGAHFISYQGGRNIQELRKETGATILIPRTPVGNKKEEIVVKRPFRKTPKNPLT